MRPVAINDISAGINTKAGKLTQGATVFIIKRFLAPRQMTVSHSFRTTVEGDDHDVATVGQSGYYSPGTLLVLMTMCITVVSEGAKP